MFNKKILYSGLSILPSIGISVVLYKYSYLNSIFSVSLSSILLAICFWLIILLFIPHEYGKVSARRTTVTAITIAFTFIFISLPTINGFETLKNYINSFISNDLKIILDDQSIITIVLIITFGTVLFFVNYLIKDNSIMKEHESSFDKYFPEREFDERLESFCNHLTIEINNYDREANWSDALYTPLEAEVEVNRQNGKSKRIANLLKAIKKDHKSKVFLVLGDPGSGKSVALRRLFRDLIKEVKSTKKIPLYINLKEWQSKNSWSNKNPPTINDLYEFCISFLKGKDRFADEFIDKYFKRLYENGHIFFIVDSFDEIPAVLDVDESSWLIDKLSEVLYSFLGGAHASRGILASRYYRKPSAKFQVSTILNIRPFSDLRVFEALNKYIGLEKNVIDKIFKERLDLLPIARNPFTVGLIYSYLKNNNDLPENQAELYKSYINQRISSSILMLNKTGLSKKHILKITSEISLYMFEESKNGLEATVNQLEKNFNNENINEIIETLVYARIARIGRGEVKKFSFVHRRFNEYFIVQKFLESPSLVNIDAIPTDNRYRDSLVLYCEIASTEHAIQIAEFCWNEVKLLSNSSVTQLKRSVQCLRFLAEAFRNRNDCIEGFRRELGEFILGILENYHDYSSPLIPKLATEAIGLVPLENRELVLLKSFSIDNWWINETAISASRHLSIESPIIRRKIILCLQQLSPFKIILKRKELFFSLSLSDSFKEIRNYLSLRVIDTYLFFPAIIILFIINPFVFALILFNFLINLVISFKTQLSIVHQRYMASLMALLFLYYGLDTLELVSPPIWLYSILIFFVFPFLDQLFFIKNVDFKKSKVKRLTKNILVYILACSAFYLVSIFFSGTIAFIMQYVMVLFFITISIFAIVRVAILVQDARLFRKQKIQNSIDRKEITETLNRFKTSFFKYKYVQRLHNNVTVCTGNWPKDVSMMGNEKYLNLLVQLDEKWLELS